MIGNGIGLMMRRRGGSGAVAASGSVTVESIDLSSATDSDFEIDVDGVHMLRLTFLDATAAASSTEKLQAKVGGTWQTSAGDYEWSRWEALNDGGINTNRTAIVMSDYDSGENAVADIWGFSDGVPLSVNMFGFGDATAATNVLGYSTFTSAIEAIRLGAAADWTSGTVQVEKFTFASFSTLTPITFSSSNSPQDIDASGAHVFLGSLLDGAGASANVIQFRASADGATFTTEGNHGFLEAGAWNGTDPYRTAATEVAHSYDSTPHDSLHAMWGFNTANPLVILGQTNSSSTTVLYSGTILSPSAPTHLRVHSFTDSVAFNAGTYRGELGTCGAVTTENFSQAVDGNATSVVFAVGNADVLQLSYGDITVGTSAWLKVEVSTDGGSTYASTNYEGAHLDVAGSTAHPTTSWRWGMGYTHLYGSILITGLQAGAYPTYYGVCNGNLSNRTIGARGVWTGGTGAITHIRVSPDGGQTMTAYQFKASKYEV